MKSRPGGPALQSIFGEDALRAALGAFATGITVVTCRDDDGVPVGLTVNSFNSVSLDPPLVLWSLARSSPTLVAFERCSHYVVNVLAAEQIDLSQRFALSSGEKFEGLNSSDGAGGAPLLAGCCAWFECSNALRHDGGDHVIFIGRVERIGRGGGEPLLYHGGRYRRLADEGEA